MNVNNFMLAIILALGLVIAIFLGVYLPTNHSGSFAAFVKVIGICCVGLALTNPRLGLNVLVVQGAYFDLLKRLAVYFGSANFSTVVEILVIPMLTLAACATGGVIRSFMQKGHLERREVMLLALSAVVGAVVLFQQSSMFGVVKGTQQTYGLVGYVLFVPLFLIVIKDQDDLLKFLRFTFWSMLPVAIYGLKQAFFGFTDFEWYYARTGFTITAADMFSTVPRPFSTLSSVAAMSVMGGCAFFAYWHMLTFPRRRLLYLLAGLFFFAAMVASLARSTIVIFPAMILAYHLFKTPFRTWCMYGALLGVFLLLVGFSKTLMEKIDVISSWMPQGSAYTQRAFAVTTYYDRLVGLSRLTEAKRWTLFGVPSKERRNSVRYEGQRSDYYTHDGINAVLLGYGVVGMVVVFGGGAVVLFLLHRKFFRIPSELSEIRPIVRLGFAYCVPFLALNLGSGTIIHVTPVNIFFWSLAAAVAYSLASAADYSRAQSRAAREADSGVRLAEAPRMAPANLRFGNR